MIRASRAEILSRLSPERFIGVLRGGVNEMRFWGALSDEFGSMTYDYLVGLQK